MKKPRTFFSLLFLTAAFSVTTSYGQQPLELEGQLSAMRISSDVARQSEGDELRSLAYDLKPTLYYLNGKILGTEDKAPVRLVVDVASLDLLTSPDSLFGSVKMICIKIESPDDLTRVLDLSGLAGFSQLKYIYFLCSFNICTELQDNSACEVQKISSLMRGKGTQAVMVFYTSVISE